LIEGDPAAADFFQKLLAVAVQANGSGFVLLTSS